MTTTQQHLSAFREKFGNHIADLSQFAHVHGGKQWEGETIPEWLESTLTSVAEEARKEEKERIIKIIDKSRTSDEIGYGPGKLEDHARWQSIADILAERAARTPNHPITE